VVYITMLVSSSEYAALNVWYSKVILSHPVVLQISRTVTIQHVSPTHSILINGTLLN